MTEGFDRSYVLIDTNAFINLTRGRESTSRLLPHVDGKRIVLSFVTVAELRRGAYVRGYGEESWRQLDVDVSSAVVVPPNDGLSHEWAKLVAEERREGRALGQAAQAHDAWVAATARFYGVPVLTEDDDFEACPRLQLLPPR